jgi:hypothetical protein
VPNQSGFRKQNRFGIVPYEVKWPRIGDQIDAAMIFARAARCDQKIIAVWRAKEHNPARKLLEYHRWHSRQSE